jgi:possible UDP-N-acetylmuramoylalanyl-D-glutamate--2, 6-diaminopimelate ligase
LNRDDPRVFRIHEKTSAAATYFGLTTDLLRLMPTDDSLKTGDAVANESVPAEVVLTAVAEQGAEFLIDGTRHRTEVALSGVYNLLNAAAALALVRTIVPEASIPVLLDALSKVKPAFGRGETITYNGTSIDLLLVKNPSGFRLSLLSFGKRQRQTMIAINDNYADGRDMSWLWDVDFSVLEDVSVVSGVRAYDMALRLSYDEVAVGTVEQDLAKALDEFLAHEPTEPKQIFCSYTAMTTLRRLLSEKTDVEDIS